MIGAGICTGSKDGAPADCFDIVFPFRVASHVRSVDHHCLSRVVDGDRAVVNEVILENVFEMCLGRVPDLSMEDDCLIRSFTFASVETLLNLSDGVDENVAAVNRGTNSRG